MQLLGIIAFLLLSQYEVSSRQNGRFTRELEFFQNSLVQRIYDDTSLADNDEIEQIATAILQEAERRLKKRDTDKGHDAKDSNYKRDADEELISDSSEEHLNANSDVDKTDTSQSKDSNDGKDGEDSDEASERYKKIIREHKKRLITNIKSKQKDLSLHANDVYIREVKVSHNDNNQIATINVDNTPDQQSRLANNPKSGKELFLETDANDDKKKNNTVAHRSPPPPKMVSNRVDRSGLDEFSFIAIIVGCCVAGVAGIGLVSFCWYKLRTETKASKNGSPNFKSNSQRNSDRKKKTSDEEKLARGAEVFHYLHAKKQMQQMEEPNLKSDHCSINESSDDEEEDEDTVYECPGLAPPGDMKVVNPLFSDTESHYSDPPSLHSTPTPPLEEK